MISFNNNGYTAAEALKALTGPNPKWLFPVAVYNQSNRFLRWLGTPQKSAGTVDIDTTRDAIWQYVTSIIDPYDFRLDPYAHRLGPEAWLRMPAPAAAGDGDPYLKYPQGLYVMPGFKRSRGISRKWRIAISADDIAYTLGFGTSSVFSVPYLGSISNAIINLAIAARIPPAFINVESLPGIVMPSPGRQWAITTPYITILRDLCTLANAEWFFDERGVFTVRKWVDPNVRALAWAFLPDAKSVVYTEYDRDEGPGLQTPNVVIGSVSRLTAGVNFTAVSRNDNANSKFSITRRGFEIPYKMTLADAPDAASFQEQVDRKLIELSYGSITGSLKTGLMPFIAPFSVISARTEDGAILLGDFEIDGNFENWVYGQMTNPRVEGGAFKARSVAAQNPQLAKATASNIGQNFDGSIYRYVKIVLKISGGGVDYLSVYFTNDTDVPLFAVAASNRQPIVCDNDYHEYMVDMWNANRGGGDKWKMGKITNIRVDPGLQGGRNFELSEVSIVKSENRFLAEKIKYPLASNAAMTLTIRPVTVTF